MHAPKRDGKTNHSKSWDIPGQYGVDNRGEQKNILTNIFNGNGERGPGYFSERGDVQSHMRLWKTLRGLDVMPVFLPHLSRELYSMLKTKIPRDLQEEVAEAAKKAMAEVVEKRVIKVKREVPVSVPNCKNCKAAEEKAKEAIKQYQFKQSKSAKAVRRVMDKILSVWKGK
jgi:hypothetical protein